MPETRNQPGSLTGGSLHQPGGASQFEQLANEQPVGIVTEFWQFLAYNKKWWLLPIVAVMLVLGGLVLLSSTPLAPFIYTLF